MGRQVDVRKLVSYCCSWTMIYFAQGSNSLFPIRWSTILYQNCWDWNVFNPDYPLFRKRMWKEEKLYRLDIEYIFQETWNRSIFIYTLYHITINAIIWLSYDVRFNILNFRWVKSWASRKPCDVFDASKFNTKVVFILQRKNK